MITSTHEAEMLTLRDRFFGAITRGDIDAVRACYAEGAIIWHNTDGIEQPLQQNLLVLGWIIKNVKDFRYEQVRFQPTPIGFVEQHLTCGTAPSGEPFSIPACIVCTIVNGRVARVDEYLDGAQADNISR